jgi:hypothetical protein
MTAYHDADDTMRKAASLLISPFFGLAYVIALPFVSIAAAGALLTKSVLGGIFILLGNFVSFGWRPAEAYLGGRKKKETRERRSKD